MPKDEGNSTTGCATTVAQLNGNIRALAVINKASVEFQMAVASASSIVNHHAFSSHLSTYVPLIQIALCALRADPPNVALAEDLLIEIEGKLFFQTEILRPVRKLFGRKEQYPLAGRSIGGIDIASKALPISFGVFALGTVMAILALSLLARYCDAKACVSLSDGLILSLGYWVCSIWGLIGGLSSVMFRMPTTTRLHTDEMRALYLNTLFRPWLGGIFASVAFFAINSRIVQLFPTEPSSIADEFSQWGLIGFAAGFVERLVPDRILKSLGTGKDGEKHDAKAKKMPPRHPTDQASTEEAGRRHGSEGATEKSPQKG